VFYFLSTERRRDPKIIHKENFTLYTGSIQSEIKLWFSAPFVFCLFSVYSHIHIFFFAPISYLTNRKQKVKIGNSYSEDQLLNFRVPQGSMLGPLIFTMYITPLSNVINQFHPLKHCLYADDTQIFTSLTPQTAQSTLQILKNCLTSIQTWMSANMLKLNPDKTEFLLLGNSSNRSKQSNCFPINFLGSSVSPTDKVRNLGVLFDADFSLSNQVSSIVSSCYYHLRDLSRIQKHLSKSVAVTMANAFISSRLDGVNSTLLGLPEKELRRHQTKTYCAA
jgi:hypothetical protein